MIPVTLQPEPPDFDKEVRKKGHEWLQSKGIARNTAPPKASDLPNYWAHSNKQLWQAYSGVCAYLAIYFDWGIGAASTDHFVAKSKKAGDAYEWDNYRLSCLGANRNKNKFDDVLDPVGLKPDTFVLNLLSGKISPNPDLSPEDSDAAWKTIIRLDLDSPENNEMRARRFSYYLRGMHEQDFKKESPFVWTEAQRQGLLRD